MNIGDKVIYIGKTFEISDVFPVKCDFPNVLTIETNSTGIIEAVYPSGSGIVSFDNSSRILLSNLSRDFIINN